MQAARSLFKGSVARSPCAEGVHVSNIQWRGRAFAASVACDSSKLQRVKKRLSKHERYSLVKSFVDRYRDINAGKFPSITVIQKQTGGSYYTIREIIQRIEHEYCKQSVEKKFVAPADKPEKKIPSRTGTEKESLVSTKFKVDPGSLEKAKKSDRILGTGTTVEVHDHKILDESSPPIVVNYTGASAFSQFEVTEKQAADNSKASSKQDPEVHHAAGRTGMEVAQPSYVTENCRRDDTTSKGPNYSLVSKSCFQMSNCTFEKKTCSCSLATEARYLQLCLSPILVGIWLFSPVWMQKTPTGQLPLLTREGDASAWRLKMGVVTGDDPSGFWCGDSLTGCGRGTAASMGGQR